MKFKLLLFILFIAAGKISYSQVFKVSNGLSVSHLKTSKFDALKKNIFSYYGSLGLDYMDKKWSCVSSEIGYVRIGGKEINESLQQTDSADYKVLEHFNFVHINSTFRIKTSHANQSLFLGAGPYINVLINPKNFRSNIYKGYTPKTVNFGCKTEIGVTQNADRFVVGVIGAYLFNLSPLAKSDYNSFTYRSFIVSVSVGYSLHNYKNSK